MERRRAMENTKHFALRRQVAHAGGAGVNARIPDAEASRQLRWQRKKVAAGLCQICGAPAAGGGHCRVHHEESRARSRAYWRTKAGIPMDAPLSNKGRPRKYTE